MPTRRSRTGDEDGFTLLEILVALAILSVSLATLLGIFSMSLDRTRQSEDEMSARVLAQSLIAQADSVSDPRLGTLSGTSNGYAWRLDLKPYGTSTQPAPAPGLASVSASVAWNGSGGRRSLMLTSLRTIPGAQLP
ncbi:MAG TPA: type II secretion system protein [Rhizomicrobium sp.]|nr:type II secretion system protein [Rhizomicrobium sp.]